MSVALVQLASTQMGALLAHPVLQSVQPVLVRAFAWPVKLGMVSAIITVSPVPQTSIQMQTVLAQSVPHSVQPVLVRLAKNALITIFLLVEILHVNNVPSDVKNATITPIVYLVPLIINSQITGVKNAKISIFPRPECKPAKLVLS